MPYSWRLLTRAHATGHSHAPTSATTGTSTPTPGRHAATVKLAGGALGAGGALSSLARPATAHAANDTSVTISDFQFTPATITIHVGDTVTWTNHGPSAHTATANNGSFNTGVLQKGHSASHTFTTAGTFTYICQIHPFMHGTVVVLANTTSTTTPKTTTTPATHHSGHDHARVDDPVVDDQRHRGSAADDGLRRHRDPARRCAADRTRVGGPQEAPRLTLAPS